MFINFDMSKAVFKWKDLNKKVGMIIVSEPTESDIAEGNYFRQVWLVDSEQNHYLLIEEDTREDAR